MTTARQLIISSLKVITAIQMDEAPTNSEAQDCLSALNRMLDSWSNESLTIYAKTLEGFNLVGGQSVYTIGPGANFNTTRPLYITGAYQRESNIDYPIEIINDLKFDRDIAQKTVQSNIINYLNYNNAYPVGTIKVWPVPTNADQLFLLSEKTLNTISTLDSDIIFPPGWERALIYNLAIEVSDSFGPNLLTPNIMKIAADAKANIKRSALRSQPQTPLAGGGRYNITGDVYSNGGF